MPFALNQCFKKDLYCIKASSEMGRSTSLSVLSWLSPTLRSSMPLKALPSLIGSYKWKLFLSSRSGPGLPGLVGMWSIREQCLPCLSWETGSQPLGFSPIRQTEALQWEGLKIDQSISCFSQSFGQVNIYDTDSKNINLPLKLLEFCSHVSFKFMFGMFLPELVESYWSL